MPISKFWSVVVIDGALTAVGGWDVFHPKNKLVTLQRGKWVEDYPAMNIARSFPTVVKASRRSHSHRGDRL